ncbi:MAG: hypothetical protein GHCLOJNM_00957 [bacterium]|nr:hypothetical protein [bacterium]
MSHPFELHNASGDTIRGDLHLPKRPGRSPLPVVVICHGFKGFKDWGFFPFVAERLANEGLAAVRFNFSHNGIAEDLQNFTRLDLFAINTFAKELEDLRAVLDAIRAGGLPDQGRLDKERVGLLGHSRGAAAVILEGTKHANVRALTTWAGIATVNRWPEEVLREWRALGHLPMVNARTGQEMPISVKVLEDIESHQKEYDIEETVARLQIPYLVVHGDEDETVPFEEALALHDNTPRGLRKLQIIPGAGHTFGTGHPFSGPTEELDQALQATIDWFAAKC